MGEAGGQGLEILVEVVLARGGQGGQGPAVEGVYQGDDGIAVRALLCGGILSRHLDGALVGLRAGVGEEDLLHAGSFAQELGELGTGLGVVEVGDVLELHGLVADGLGPGLIAEAEAGNADAGAQVDVLFAVSGGQDAAVALDKLHGEPAIGTGHEFLIDGCDAHVVHPFVCTIFVMCCRGGALTRPVFCIAKDIRRQANKGLCSFGTSENRADFRRAGRGPAPTE